MTSLLSLQYVTPLTTQQQQQNQDNERYTNNTKLRHIKPLKNSNNNNNNNRLAYVEALVDANALVIESIWYSSTTATNNSSKSLNSVVPLRIFIQEVLKRSRTTYSTLQTALFYLFRSKPDIQLHLSNNNNDNNKWEDAYISCGRRMFLASLVVASKFVQDKTYRNSAWAKIAGLPVNEINAAERIFLHIINYRLYISQPTFEQWHHLLHLHVEAKTLNRPTTIKDFSNLSFQPIDLFYKQQQQQQHSFYLLQHQKENITPYHHHQHMNNNSHIHSSNSSSSSNYSPTTPPYHTTNNGNHGHGWTIVLSPTTFLPTGVNNNSIKKRQHHYNHPPSLSMSLPSSINSSPMQTPTQISPVRINGNTSVFNWASTNTTAITTTSPSLPVTSFDQNHHRSIINSNNNKKRKYSHIIVEPTRSSYNISNVRQQQSSTSTPSSKRFHYS